MEYLDFDFLNNKNASIGTGFAAGLLVGAVNLVKDEEENEEGKLMYDVGLGTTAIGAGDTIQEIAQRFDYSGGEAFAISSDPEIRYEEYPFFALGYTGGRQAMRRIEDRFFSGGAEINELEGDEWRYE